MTPSDEDSDFIQPEGSLEKSSLESSSSDPEEVVASPKRRTSKLCKRSKNQAQPQKCKVNKRMLGDAVDDSDYIQQEASLEEASFESSSGENQKR
mmetsp:Transcript_12932/g.23307  ORF Transcript_12932/g.23307 Transcript_12932/m.23307 type:complete len:95 (+) Transcript_12932:362-646(+)